MNATKKFRILIPPPKTLKLAEIIEKIVGVEGPLIL